MEIFNGITSDNVLAEYFDSKALTAAPYKVYQLNSKAGRYYYTTDNNGVPTFYPSVTTILDAAMPANEYLTKWIADKGYTAAENYKNERAKYGSFMHSLFAKLAINGTIDLDGIAEDLKGYIENNQLPSDFFFNLYELKKDVLAFAQWVIDYEVEPLAVELPLVHKILGYAGTIDFVCRLRPTAKAKEKVVAIVDFKSGRNAFYDEHAAQLHFYKEMFEYNFGQAIQKVYNFSPKDWRKTPTYNFKDQSESEWAEMLPELLRLGTMRTAPAQDKTFINCGGVITLGASLADNITTLSLSEIVSKHHRQAVEEQSTAEPTAEEQPTAQPTTAPKAEIKKELSAILDF